MDNPTATELRGQIEQLTLRLRQTEGHMRLLRAMLVALVAATPKGAHAAIGECMALMWSDLQTKMDRSPERVGAKTAWNALQG
jgi:hypothetical protein